MNKGGKFSVYEGVLFITTTIVSKILYTSTPAVVKQVGTAAWYTTIISCATSLILFLTIFLSTMPSMYIIKALNFPAILNSRIFISLFSG